MKTACLSWELWAGYTSRSCSFEVSVMFSTPPENDTQISPEMYGMSVFFSDTIEATGTIVFYKNVEKFGRA